jgi:hypothetical protein
MSVTLILANLAPLFLGLGSISAFAWFLDALMGPAYRANGKKGDEESEKESEPSIGWRRGIVRLIGLFGIPMGIFCFASLVSVILTPLHPFGDFLTLFLLAWTGIALFLTPINKLPWAALIGLVAAIIAVIAVTLVAPVIPEVITYYIPLKYILIGTFLIVGILVFSLFRWAESLLDLATGIFGSRPMLLILTFIGLAQAIALPAVFLLTGGGGGGILWFFIH